MSKYIFVTGGVVSSLGKGITAASLGRLLIERGIKVNVLKLDPYLNINPSNMDPEQHGEVFVTFDGHESDLDLGHYERFLDINCSKRSNFTSGRIYSNIFAKDRAGEYGGATIQVVPHVTGEIKNVMRNAGGDADVVIIEIGGTVGDMEGLSFLEAIRQFERELGVGNYLHIHCTLVPFIESAGEVKTKPTQHSVKELTSLGLTPDIIVCRTNKGVDITEQNKKKIAMFCNLDSPKCVIHNPDCSSIYEVPLVIANQNMDELVCNALQLKATKLNISKWKKMVETMNSDMPSINVAIVGKFMEVRDSYISVIEAVKHAGLHNKYKVNLEIVSCEEIEKRGAKALLKGFDGVIMPDGVGDNGNEGMILTAKYCRENKVPFLGLVLGMQMAVIEFARNVAKLKGANTTEFFSDLKNPVIDINPISKEDGLMRLGNYTCVLANNSKAKKLYGVSEIEERHRNMYEVNGEYVKALEEAGMVIAGVNKETNFVELIEYADHPFFMASIYHAEFLSRPYRAHPLFIGFVKGCINSHKTK